jgi:hypothetical protein
MSLEKIVENEMRFSAMEYVLSNLIVSLYLNAKTDKKKIDAMHQELIEKAGARTFPELDPAMSDVAATAFQDSLRTLLNGQREMMGMPRL